jgi:hypothetical protein
MPQDCPKKDKIDKDADDAKGHIDNVLKDPSLSRQSRHELDLALTNIKNIRMDNHTK